MKGLWRPRISYFVVYPSQQAAPSKIRALVDVLFRLAQED
ncbi:transcriptional regulator, LysR family domain protein [Burkholderia cepacia]|nr:transcriptional regulator, LysR family domain protein [Burkholderia cepacia]